jgi:hypothetical protein
MSPSEVVWRTRNLARDVADMGRLRLGVIPPRPPVNADLSIEETRRGFSLTRPAEDFAALDADGRWRRSLLGAADDIAAGRLSYFNFERVHLGQPIDWHRDHNSGKATSRKMIQRIDYRDLAANGDCKEVWEPNRHHQFVILARAYAATRDLRYAESLVAQMSGWMDENPYGYGMNWRSPLELAVRMINWVFALELIRDSGLLTGNQWRAIYESIQAHCWETYRKISRGSSANNHVIGELAGVFVAASWLPGLPGAARMAEECRAGLVEEIGRQTYEDGCNREHALGYQFFVIQFHLVSAMVGRWSGNEFPDEYLHRLKAMLEFVASLAEGGPLPLFGDQDDGYVLDLGNPARDVGALMDIGCKLFEMSDTARRLATRSESAWWLLGNTDSPAAASISEAPLISTAFAGSGYYLLQSGRGSESISLLFDCAELGYGAIAAHGHADALSIALRAYGEYLLVDTGTYDYFTYPAFRNYFRSTAAHNTVEIDGQDQSVMSGPFLWGRRASTRVLEWSTNAEETTVTGEHDGYARLADPVVHRRSLTLSHADFRCNVVDRLIARADHTAKVRFHLGPACTVGERRGNTVAVDVRNGLSFKLTLDARLEIELLRGSEEPMGGWYSPAYHRKLPVTTIVGSLRISGDTTLQHRIDVHVGR